jgi:hypothetical protein
MSGHLLCWLVERGNMLKLRCKVDRSVGAVWHRIRLFKSYLLEEVTLSLLLFILVKVH